MFKVSVQAAQESIKASIIYILRLKDWVADSYECEKAVLYSFVLFIIASAIPACAKINDMLYAD